MMRGRRSRQLKHDGGTDASGPAFQLAPGTLAHFLFENPKYRESAMALVQRGGGLEAFEQLIGPVATIEPEWHHHVRRIKAALDGKDLNFHKTGRLPFDP